MVLISKCISFGKQEHFSEDKRRRVWWHFKSFLPGAETLSTCNVARYRRIRYCGRRYLIILTYLSYNETPAFAYNRWFSGSAYRVFCWRMAVTLRKRIVLNVLVSVFIHISSGAKLNVPKLLLPYYSQATTNFTLQASEGCFIWYVHFGIIALVTGKLKRLTKISPYFTMFGDIPN